MKIAVAGGTGVAGRPTVEALRGLGHEPVVLARSAGVGHIVVLSIIAIDRVPYGYYKGKSRQEEALRDSPVPVSILRTAQFHEFPVQYLAQSKGRFLVVPKMRIQPVAVREVGAALARIAVGSPTPMSELAGPREEMLADMIRQVIHARGARRRVIEVRVPGAAGKAMATGGILPGKPGERGMQTFAAWLREQQASGTL
jgi:uncharacterized protein YbjT (DUF2867 family)